MIDAFRRHWPEYLFEALALGLFMLSAIVVTALVESDGSPVRAAVPDAAVRRLLIGLAMGLTAVGLIYSPFGRRSGAHMNPAVTLVFWRLGKVGGYDAAGYAVAQLVGGTIGTLAGAAAVAPLAGDGAARLVVTVPGHHGPAAAFVAEATISFAMMLTILAASNHPRFARYTGVLAGALVALFIVVEAPLSGMSMNPARTVASAFPTGTWTALWVYLSAPPLGMLAAAGAYVRATGHDPLCAKLQHDSTLRCIFCGGRAPGTAAAFTEGVRHA